MLKPFALSYIGITDNSWIVYALLPYLMYYLLIYIIL